jgi:predicted RNA-binding Zn-ribbon protein involved in translation (DUF1610 family)
MHPRVAARIGLKLLGILVLVFSLSYLGFVAQSLFDLMDSFASGDTIGESLFDYGAFIQIVYLCGPLLQITLGAMFFFRADAIAKRIAPPTGRLCGDCGYDLKGITADACPECGAPVRRAAAARSESREANEEHNDNAPAFRPGR